jgi:lysophospholipase L1-like esterase
VSYRAGGYWTQVLNQIAQYKAKHEVFVTIQFGHNDQKNAAYEQAFSANLKQFAVDVSAAGGVPVSNLFLQFIYCGWACV